MHNPVQELPGPGACRGRDALPPSGSPAATPTPPPITTFLWGSFDRPDQLPPSFGARWPLHGCHPRPGNGYRVWDVASGSERLAIARPWGPASSLAFSADGKGLIVNGAEAVAIYDAASGRLRLRLEGH